MVLGFSTMGGFVLSTSIFKIFAPKSGKQVSLDYKKFWKHSLVTAVSSKVINRYLYFPEDDELFSAAILHDIGKIILDQYDHENYAKVLSDIPNQIDFKGTIEAEEKYCETIHPDIGYVVAESWNLPEKLSDVIKFHHTPFESEENSRLAAIVYLGNVFASILLDLEMFDSSLFDETILEYFGLSEDDLLSINAEIIESIQEIDDFEIFFK